VLVLFLRRRRLRAGLLAQPRFGGDGGVEPRLEVDQGTRVFG
jgi:hypothetical protein